MPAAVESDKEKDIDNPEKIANNVRIVYSSRIFLSIIAGCTAGILGLTGLIGFACYLLLCTLQTIVLLFKIKFKVHTFYKSLFTMWLEGLVQGLLSFILFWTLIYDIVHIY